jgi:glyoxylase-like metal-dependent hydrolase (beta-lactamase superfamily II)
MAKAICHTKGARFLVEPAKLWEGSRKVLGKLAEAYGAPQPVEADRVIPHTENPLPALKILETPGHAPHHLSFGYEKNLFAGEAAGNYFIIDEKEYFRPATPPRFFLDVCLNSVDRMLALEDQPIHYAHFGRAENSHRLLKMFRDQLMRWNDLIYEQFCLGQEGLVQRCLETLIERDPDLAAFRLLGKDDQERERYFMTNSVRGFVAYFQERDEKRKTS